MEVLSLMSKRMLRTPCGKCLRALRSDDRFFFKGSVEPQVEGVVRHACKQDEAAANDS